MIQLHRLEGFYRVARAGGYARAVRDFPYPITEPAVHQQVRKLEDELGQRLLYRTAKDRMTLTAAGAHLFDYCSPFFDRLPEVVSEVVGGHFAGTLRIDAGPQEIRHIIPGWLQNFRKLHADVRVELQEVQAVEPARLRSGQADLIIEHWPNPPADVAQKVIAKVYAVWVVPLELAKNGRVRLEALMNVPFVSFHPSAAEHALQSRGLKLHELNPPRLLTASTVDAILGFVQAGLGYSCIPWPAPDGPKLRGVIAERMRLSGAAFPIAASWLARAANPLLASALALAPSPRDRRRPD